MKARWSHLALLGSLGGCGAPHPATVAAVAPPVAVAPAPSLPPGATPGMLVPEALADGSFPTPNRGLAGVAAIWHLRAGLNVAALSCPGVEGATIRAGYNSWLKREKAPLARAAKGYAASYTIKVGPGSYDDAMTRLYNFFSQTPVRGPFCSAAAAVAADLAIMDEPSLPDFAATRLTALDRPFVDFYRAYDAWRGGVRPLSPAPVVIAAAAPAPTIAYASLTRPVVPSSAPTTVSVGRRPMLTLDLSTLPADGEVTAAR